MQCQTLRQNRLASLKLDRLLVSKEDGLMCAAIRSQIMAELLGKAVGGPSPGAPLRAYCKARLCWRKPLSTQTAAEFAVLLKAWYLTDAWLHQAGIYHERLSSVQASLLSPFIWQLIKE